MKSSERDIAVVRALPAATSPATVSVGPRGVGMSVAFDWALAAQMLFVAASYALNLTGVIGSSALTSGQRLGTAALAVLAAVPCALFGEGMRRGVRPLRPVQIAGNALLVLYGLVQLPTLGGLRAGHLSPLVRTVVLLGVSPLIVYLLSRPQTREWFATVTSAEARARHGRWWVAHHLLWALLGGAAIAFAAVY